MKFRNYWYFLLYHWGMFGKQGTSLILMVLGLATLCSLAISKHFYVVLMYMRQSCVKLACISGNFACICSKMIEKLLKFFGLSIYHYRIFPVWIIFHPNVYKIFLLWMLNIRYTRSIRRFIWDIVRILFFTRLNFNFMQYRRHNLYEVFWLVYSNSSKTFLFIFAFIMSISTERP